MMSWLSALCRNGFMFCMALGVLACKPMATVFVETPVGTIGGIEKKSTQQFLGIPYAQPPVGELRWREALPLPPFEEVYQATQPGTRCIQFAQGTESLAASEDCLFLNIWRPTGENTPTENSNLPVVLFIHGSAFAFGSSNEVLWDGSQLASAHNVIVVTMNYRLGYLGFLSLPELTQESGHSGNYSFYDQQMALKWVHNNISAFGGDRNRIMLFGQSAGAMSTCMHLASDDSSPLISSAAIASGFCLDKVLTQEQAEEFGSTFAVNAGCPQQNPLECLREKSIEEIDQALVASGIKDRLFAPNPALPVIPVVDGKFIDRQPREKLAAGAFSGKSVIIGATPEEGTIFFITHPPIADEATYLELLESEYGDRAGDVAALYPFDAYKTGRGAYAALSGDRFFSCNAKGTANVLDQGGAEVYFFEFNQWISPLLPRLFGALGFETGPIHGAELLYLFSYDPLSSNLKPETAYVAKLMQSYWVNQASNGTPNGGDLPQWPAYTRDAFSYLELDSDPQVKANLKAEKCALLNSLPLIHI